MKKISNDGSTTEGREEWNNKDLTCWKSSFLAGTRFSPRTRWNNRTFNKDQIERALRKGVLGRLTRRDLPEPPKNHFELNKHPLGGDFKKAEEDHLESHKPTKTWTIIDGWEAR